MTPRQRGRIWLAVVVGALIVIGSVVYWMADGRVGTPEEFRQRVTEAGLEVDWSTSGPRGGVGSVETSCGPVDVGIDEVDGVLWIRWAGNREVATPETIDALVSCRSLPGQGDPRRP